MKGNLMKVIIDEEECVGCQTCSELCPEVFRFVEEKDKAEVILPEGGPKDCIDEAIDACAVAAIHWQN
jgi:ferredoxin